MSDHECAVVACITAARLLAAHDLPKLIENASRAEAVGPFLDPTLYREKGQALSEDKALLRAALPLWELARTLQREVH